MRRTLDEVCESIADGDHQAPPKSPDGIPFITISCLDPNGDRPDFESAAKVPLEYYASLQDNRRAKPGDVFLSVVGSLGIPYLVKEGDQFVFQGKFGEEATVSKMEIVLEVLNSMWDECASRSERFSGGIVDGERNCYV